MTETKQRIAIAEACGWKWENYEGGIVTFHWGWFCPEGRIQSHPHDISKKITGSYCLPDYLNDLNAMHEAEKVLSYAHMSDFLDLLCEVVGFGGMTEDEQSWLMYRATATQRAEAFLKTLNLWED